MQLTSMAIMFKWSSSTNGSGSGKIGGTLKRQPTFYEVCSCHDLAALVLAEARQ